MDGQIAGLSLALLLALAGITAHCQQSPAPHGGQIPAKQDEQRRAILFVQRRGIGVARSARRIRTAPAAALSRARAEHAAMLRTAATQPASAVWQAVGPMQVSTPAWSLVTGRVTALAADPSDPTGNTLYVGTTGGGVWKSTNAAGAVASASFVPLTDDLGVFPSAAPSSLSIGAVTVQPGGTGVVLAGTGDPNDATDSWYGVGVLRSADGGNTWNLISASIPPIGGMSFDFFGNAFAGFAWSGAQPNLVVAAVSQSEYGALLQMPEQQSLPGLYYSSDAGATWQLATIEDGSQVIQSASTSQILGNAATSVAWNPVRQRFYAAIRFHGYYESSDGITWTRLANQPGANLTTTQCPANPGTIGSPACPLFRGTIVAQPVTGDLFTLTVDENSLDEGLWQDACGLTNGACVYKTVQFQTEISDAVLDSVTGDGTLPEGPYTLALAAVPAAGDTLLFAGTTDLWRCSLVNGCPWRNTTNTQTCAAAKVAPEQHSIETTFGAAGLLFFGNDGGTWRSTDAVNQRQLSCAADDAAHFQNLNGGLGSLAEVESFSEDPNDPGLWMAALGDLGTAAPAADGAPWNQVLDGEGNFVAIDPVQPEDWYATSVFGVGINQCGAGSACTTAGFGSVAIGEPQVEDDLQLIPAPWILDPLNTENVILGTCRVWRGPGTGANWSQDNLLSGILDGQQGSFCDGDSEIRTLAAGVNSSGNGGEEQLYAGMAGSVDGGNLVPGHVFTAVVNSSSQAASTAWTDVYGSPVTNHSGDLEQFNPGGYDVSSLYADPHDATGQTVYATIQGYSDNEGFEPVLYRSADAGAHWVDLSANLPHAPANSVLVDPNNANIVYVALDTGVYYTENFANCISAEAVCWNVFGSGLPNAPVMSLMAFNEGATQQLRAATYGRGIWELNLLTAGTVPTTAAVSPSSLTFPAQTVQTASPAQTVTVTDSGTLNLNIASVAISGDFTETDTCTGASIAPASQCTLQVVFDPSQPGSRAGTLTLFGNVAGGQILIPLTGTGLAPKDIVLSPSALTFPATPVGSDSAAQSITLANEGNVAVALSSEAVSGAFAILANTCSSSIAAQTSCQIAIVFEPTTPGAANGALTVTDAWGTLTAPLGGTGQSPATDELSPPSLTFFPQTVGTSSPAQTVTLTNSGDAALTGITVAGTGNFSLVNNCGALLQGHASCAIAVTFAPASIGAQSGSLTVTDVLRAQAVSLIGTGTAPPGVSATPGSLDFGGLGVGTTSVPQTVTLTNNGGAALSGLTAVTTTGFAIASNNCPATLATDAQCQIGVTFSPATVGAATGTLTVAAASLSNPRIVTLTGAGEDFTIAVNGSSSAVITSGLSATFTLQLAGLAGTTGTAALACSGAPQYATCSLDPASLALVASGDSTASLTLATGIATSASLEPGLGWRGVVSACALLVPIGWCGWMGRGRRRRDVAPWMCILLAIGLLITAGCGVSASTGSGGGGSGGSQLPTPPGNYVVTVKATMANVTHSTAVNLTVQ